MHFANSRNLIVAVASLCTAALATGCGGSNNNKTSTVPALNACLADNPTRPASLISVLETIQTAINGKGTPSETYVGVMANQNSRNWTPAQAGFTQAQTELKCLGDFHFPPASTDPNQADFDFDQQAALSAWTTGMQGSYSSVLDGTVHTVAYPKANAIALSAKTAGALDIQINAAIDVGIPVIGFDSDSPASNRALFVGEYNSESGTAAASELIALLGTTTTGTVEILEGKTAGAPGDSQYDRVQSILAAFAATQVGSPTTTTVGTGATAVKSVVTIYSSPTFPSLTLVTETSIDGVNFIVPTPTMVSTYPAAGTTPTSPLVGVITVDSNVGPLLADWLQLEYANSKNPHIQVVTWDTNSPILADIQNGIVQATVAQRAYFYGYLSVYIGYAMAALGQDAVMTLLAPFLIADPSTLKDGAVDFLSAGTDLITADNVTDYFTYQSQCLGVTQGY